MEGARGWCARGFLDVTFVMVLVVDGVRVSLTSVSVFLCLVVVRGAIVLDIELEYANL